MSLRNLFLPLVIFSQCFLLLSCKRLQDDFSDVQSFSDNYRLDLIAEDPQIVTPIGITVDTDDQVYVLESHTHLRPSDYPGPKFDRILRGVDENNDGIPESWKIFADSLSDAMNLACDEVNTIFVTEKDALTAFKDIDRDGVADERVVLVRMSPPDNIYDHAGILGIALGANDWVYISRGNTGGQTWQIMGTDGKTIKGYGDGGNVFRCKKDGTQIEEIATGFWNPFALDFDENGRLLLIDNDPDSRGPNRLVEIVPKGEYGYQSMYGGSGIHPYLAWNGELPGTLPYTAALGEAPSGLMTQFTYKDKKGVLISIWEENNLVFVPLDRYPPGVYTGNAELFFQGDSLFRPVAFARNSKGDIYLTDWVIRQYPNHGKGKIWRIQQQSDEGSEIAFRKSSKGFERWQKLIQKDEAIIAALQSDDPFVQLQGRRSLLAKTDRNLLYKLTEDKNQNLRLQALLCLDKMPGKIDKNLILRFLHDDNELIRKMAMIHVGRKGRKDCEKELKQLLYKNQISPSMLNTYLATLKHLNPVFIQAKANQSERLSKNLPRQLPEGFIFSKVMDSSLPPSLRAAMLPYVENSTQAIAQLVQGFHTAESHLKLGILEWVKGDAPLLSNRVITLIRDSNQPSKLRAMGISFLQYQSEDFCQEMVSLLSDREAVVRMGAARYVCRCDMNEAISLEIEAAQDNHILKEIVEKCKLGSEEEWPDFAEYARSHSGDPINGKMVFRSQVANCQVCHTVDGWGGALGPDLSHVGASKNKEQLLRAILQPSEEIAPGWQGWFVKDKNGDTHVGRQIDVGLNNVELYLQTGKFEVFNEPSAYGILPYSLMPDGLENSLTPTEFVDLISFLMTLK